MFIRTSRLRFFQKKRKKKKKTILRTCPASTLRKNLNSIRVHDGPIAMGKNTNFLKRLFPTKVATPPATQLFFGNNFSNVYPFASSSHAPKVVTRATVFE